MKPANLKAILTSLLLAASGLAAAADAGVYIGGGIGSAATDRSGYDNAGSYKVFAGAKVESFGVELAYIDLGRFNQKGNSSNNHTVDGAQVNAIGELFINHGLYGYGSFGFYNWSLDDKLNAGDSGTSLTLGLGLKVLMGKHFAVRGGWDRYQNIADSKVDMLSLNGVFQF